MHPEIHPALRIIGVILLVLILILGAWGIVVLFTWISGGLHSNTGTTTPPLSTTTPAQTLTVSLSSSAPLPSGTPFTISWMHTNGSGAYGYTVSYSCGANNAVSIDAPVPTGTYKSVPCNTPFNYTNATSQMKLIPHVAASAAQGASVQFTVSAIELSTGRTAASGSVIASVLPGSGSTPTTPPAKGTSPKGNGGYVSNPNGVVDLSVQILSLTPTSAQFKISNIGTKTAPAGWTFSAQLPTSGEYPYSSPLQQALTPGSYIINTLNWSAPSACPAYQTYPYGYQYPSYNCYGSTNVFSVTVDPYHVSGDVYTINNYASATI